MGAESSRIALGHQPRTVMPKMKPRSRSRNEPCGGGGFRSHCYTNRATRSIFKATVLRVPQRGSRLGGMSGFQRQQSGDSGVTGNILPSFLETKPFDSVDRYSYSWTNSADCVCRSLAARCAAVGFLGLRIRSFQHRCLTCGRPWVQFSLWCLKWPDGLGDSGLFGTCRRGIPNLRIVFAECGSFLGSH